MLRPGNALRRFGAITLTIAPAASAPAEIIPIINPGFEDLNAVLRPGEQTNGAGGGITPVTTRWPSPFSPNGNTPQSGVLVPGWRTYTPAPPAIVSAGALNPDVQISGTPWLTGYGGSHVAAVQVAPMQQTLSAQVQPNTTYTLSFSAGLGWTDTTNGVYMFLLAAPDTTTLAFFNTPNVLTLVQTSGAVIPAADRGFMHPFSISYTSPATLPESLVGRHLAICFIGSDGIPRVCFDDFQLTATPIPAPPVILALGAGLTLRRRRASL